MLHHSKRRTTLEPPCLTILFPGDFPAYRFHSLKVRISRLFPYIYRTVKNGLAIPCKAPGRPRTSPEIQPEQQQHTTTLKRGRPRTVRRSAVFPPRRRLVRSVAAAGYLSLVRSRSIDPEILGQTAALAFLLQSIYASCPPAGSRWLFSQRRHPGSFTRVTTRGRAQTADF